MPIMKTSDIRGQRAVIYTRVSTEEQAREVLSLEAQEIACREYCQSNGLEVVHVFVEEGESAKTANRTQLKELLKFCREDRNIGVVVIYKVDRFNRSQEHHQIRALLTAMGVTLRSATEPIDDSSTGKFIEQIFVAVAELDNNIRADRSVQGMRQRLQKGFWVFPPPLGYVAGTDAHGNKNIIPDPKRADHVTWAFERFSTGLYSRQQVLRDASLRGLRTRKDKRVSAQTFEQTLRKPVYAGRIIVQGWDIDVEGKHQPLASADVFERVQLILQGRRRIIAPRARGSENFPLVHFVRCGECGQPLTGSSSKGRNQRYPYYHCQDGCTRVRKVDFETGFADLLNRLQPNPEYVALFREVILDVLRAKQHDILEAQTGLERKLLELRRNRDKLDEAFIFRQQIDVGTYRRMKEPLVCEITLTEIELQEASVETVNAEEAIDFALDVLANVSNRWKTATATQKQRFQQVLFPEGLEYINGEYRTSETCFLFNSLGSETVCKEELVALPGIEPGFED